ncbi:single-stranded DNA-binding protein [bacterium (Candidatus Moisslbacteria) CG12_big_fil_rev_8_21_14_0_65_36_11]|nr:single-stranded DNA-binding protein [Candidatus Kuenenbacteria bacterium]OIP76294.1 MAG: hypothetical protein AUK09_02400 [Parcubacteria group bacterium CG2_30_36_38]PIV46217.1 MAG: single-stranded DNA-binding protein [bacterium (Candidatus Moisslbacteria) CG02_land_8_20_14_3_00_36_53]PIW68031.1 MAG: single-stranded DNA-binding protein [bacterium (Candidatus Moisslbacteria) CG12_big_fil_rev_8_21_14_0_65_36_11]PIZ90181.1 MAG: single-stranded DNA-binding protein [bacterium (Candidatus Moisslba
MNVNKVIILGNLTRDPEIRTTPNNQSVASFGMATNRYWTDKQTGEKKQMVEYHNVTCWRKLAEIAQKFLKKGNLVYIEGRLQTRTWTDQSGNKRSKTDIIAERIQLGPKGLRPEQREAQEEPAQKPSTEEIEEIPLEEGNEEISPEEIPF